MEAFWNKLLDWWNKTSTQKRWSSVALLVGVVCTLVLIFLPNSYPSTSNTFLSSTDGVNDSLFYLDIIIKTVGILLLIVGGAIVLRWFQKRQNKARFDRALSVVESIRLSPKQALHLVRVGDKFFLVGATDQNLNLISQVEPFRESAVEGQPAPFYQQSFESVLTDATKAKAQIKLTNS